MDIAKATFSNRLQSQILNAMTLNNLFLGYLCVFFTVKLFIDGK